MNSAVLVSILIPASNPRFFDAALESAMVQRYGSVEIVVCDGSRGDEIAAIFHGVIPRPGLHLRYVRNTNSANTAANLLKCLSEAKGEFIKFLCDDDLLLPECVALQAQILREHPDVTLVLGKRRFWDCDGIQLPDRLENTPLSPVTARLKGCDLLALFQSYPRNLLGGFSCALMRRLDVVDVLPSLVRPADGFSSMLDFALFLSLLKRGDAVMFQSVLSIERLHHDGCTAQETNRKLAESEGKRLSESLSNHRREAPPAFGWVRYQPISQPHVENSQWEEMNLGRILGSLRSTLPFQVGVGSESFSELYAEWLGCRATSDADRRLLPGIIAGWPVHPKIVIVVRDEHASEEDLSLTLASISTQVYAPEGTVVLSRNCSEAIQTEQLLRMPLQDCWATQLNGLLPQLTGWDWFYLLEAGDRLADSALLMIAERIATSTDIFCLYSDEGAIREGVSVDPVFKPDFNLDFLRSYPYVGRTLAFDRDNFMRLGGFEPMYGALSAHDLLWRTIETNGFNAIEHISHVIVESRFSLMQWLSLPHVIEQSPKVVEAHLNRMGVKHHIRKGRHGVINVIGYRHLEKPVVSILITHKDQLAALQRCIETLLEKTSYGFYEVLIIDSGSTESATLGWLAGMAELGTDKIRVVHISPAASPAALRNAAASEARGDYLLLLSPYAVITNGDWLSELLNHAQRPEVGIVGAKLVTPDARVLHAGLILGLQGCVASAFFGEDANADGYMCRLQAVQNLSATGADCLMVRKQVYAEVGGLEETVYHGVLSVVDLCLRVREHGFMVVWTPYAQLVMGAQPATAIRVQSDKHDGNDLKAFYLRWLSRMARDPAYNVNLELSSGSFALHAGERSGWTPISDRGLPIILGMPINTTGVGGYRVVQPFSALEAAGLAVGRLSYATQPSIIQIERQSPDVIVLQGRYTREAIQQIEPLKTYSRARLIYELDDYIFNTPKKNGHMRGMPADLERFVAEGARLCHRMVVSTQPLADALASLHHDIRVVPNTLVPHLWKGLKAARGTSKKPRIGWGGGTSHTGDLEIIAPVVRTLATEVDWVFFGMCPAELRPYVKEFHEPVDFQRYPAKLSSLNLDIALAPLEFHIFNDCKSNLRLLEYGACGYPVIASDTLAYRGDLPCTLIETNSADEWLQAIGEHLADPLASHQMGDELHEAVMRDYLLEGENLQRWVNGWLAD